MYDSWCKWCIKKNDSYHTSVAVVSIITYIIIIYIISYLFQKRQQDSIRCHSWWFDHQTWGCGNSFCCVITNSLTRKDLFHDFIFIICHFHITRRKLSSYYFILLLEILSYVSIYDYMITGCIWSTNIQVFPIQFFYLSSFPWRDLFFRVEYKKDTLHKINTTMVTDAHKIEMSREK